MTRTKNHLPNSIELGGQSYEISNDLKLEFESLAKHNLTLSPQKWKEKGGDDSSFETVAFLSYLFFLSDENTEKISEKELTALIAKLGQSQQSFFKDIDSKKFVAFFNSYSILVRGLLNSFVRIYNSGEIDFTREAYSPDRERTSISMADFERIGLASTER